MHFDAPSRFRFSIQKKKTIKQYFDKEIVDRELVNDVKKKMHDIIYLEFKFKQGRNHGNFLAKHSQWVGIICSLWLR